MQKEKRPFGTWDSPLKANLIAQSALRLREPKFIDGNLYWIEGRPKEEGREVLLKRSHNGEIKELTSAPFSVKSRVHEYGGGGYLVTSQGILFCEGSDNRLYQISPEGTISPFTAPSAARFADGTYDPIHNRSVWVCEDHSQQIPSTVPSLSHTTPSASLEPVNSLVIVSETGKVTPLVTGSDFFAFPRWNPGTNQLAWISWNHPQMPWDGTELWFAEVSAEGTLEKFSKIAGGNDESILQPEWSTEGKLFYLSDRSGWWNLYSWHPNETVCELPLPREIGGPAWNFGEKYYAFLSAHEILFTANDNNQWRLGKLDLRAKTHTFFF